MQFRIAENPVGVEGLGGGWLPQNQSGQDEHACQRRGGRIDATASAVALKCDLSSG